jgi:hypothetical protein
MVMAVVAHNRTNKTIGEIVSNIVDEAELEE